MNIRKATITDLEGVWTIFAEVIKGGDTFVFDPDTPKSDLKKYWFNENMSTFVIEDNGIILGSYMIKPNQIGLGSHIANCGYMVSPNARGKGVGKRLCEHSIQTAIAMNFEAIQFNIVVSTNTQAVELWRKYGFKIIGTTPKGFQHKTLGLVDTHIMYKALK